MLIQKCCKTINITFFKLKPHQNRCLLNFIKHLYCFLNAANIPAYHITQKISCQSSLARIDQTEPLIQFFLCILTDFAWRTGDFLLNCRFTCHHLNSRCKSTNLILPSAAGGEQLFQYQCIIADVVPIPCQSAKIIDSSEYGRCKDRTGT